jgi:hypothetical protein
MTRKSVTGPKLRSKTRNISRFNHANLVPVTDFQDAKTPRVFGFLLR